MEKREIGYYFVIVFLGLFSILFLNLYENGTLTGNVIEGNENFNFSNDSSFLNESNSSLNESNDSLNEENEALSEENDSYVNNETISNETMEEIFGENVTEEGESISEEGGIQCEKDSDCNDSSVDFCQGDFSCVRGKTICDSGSCVFLESFCRDVACSDGCYEGKCRESLCGNGICDENENEVNCQEDCFVGLDFSDFICEVNEDCLNFSLPSISFCFGEEGIQSCKPNFVFDCIDGLCVIVDDNLICEDCNGECIDSLGICGNESSFLEEVVLPEFVEEDFVNTPPVNPRSDEGENFLGKTEDSRKVSKIKIPETRIRACRLAVIFTLGSIDYEACLKSDSS